MLCRFTCVNCMNFSEVGNHYVLFSAHFTFHLQSIEVTINFVVLLLLFPDAVTIQDFYINNEFPFYLRFDRTTSSVFSAISASVLPGIYASNIIQFYNQYFCRAGSRTIVKSTSKVPSFHGWDATHRLPTQLMAGHW